MELNITRRLITAPPIHPIHEYLLDQYTSVWVNHTRAKHQSPQKAGTVLPSDDKFIFILTHFAWRQEALFQS